MDFPFESYKEAFREGVHQGVHRPYRLYAFLLITPSSAEVYKSLLEHAYEISELTGDEILVIGPKPQSFMDRKWFLQSMRFHGDRQSMKEWADQMTREVYEFLDFLGESRSNLPAILFFDDLLQPSRYIVWRLREGGYEFLEEWRRVMDHLALNCGWINTRKAEQLESVIDTIHIPSDKDRDHLVELIKSSETKISDLSLELKEQPNWQPQPGNSTKLVSSVAKLQMPCREPATYEALRAIDPDLPDFILSLSEEVSFSELQRLIYFRKRHFRALPSELRSRFDRLISIASERWGYALKHLESLRQSLEQSYINLRRFSDELSSFEQRKADAIMRRDSLIKEIEILLDKQLRKRFDGPLDALVALDPKRFTMRTGSLISGAPPFWMPKEVFTQVSKGKSLILFVHGLGGHWQETWQGFPSLIQSDEDLSQRFDVDYYSFPASLLSIPFISRPPRVQQLAEGLRTQIRVAHAKYDEIVLVCHSLGGLVARKYILDEVEGRKKLPISKLLLFAVPNNGAQLASIGKFVPWSNRQIAQLCKTSDFIEFVNDRWFRCKDEGLLDDLQITYIVAGLDEIVDVQSAKGFWGNSNVHTVINKGHVDLVKPKSSEDFAFRILKQAVL